MVVGEKGCGFGTEDEPKMPGAQTLLRYSDLGIDIVMCVGCIADVSGVVEVRLELLELSWASEEEGEEERCMLGDV